MRINLNSFVNEMCKIAAPTVEGHPLFVNPTPMPAVPPNSPEGHMQQLYEQQQQQMMMEQQQMMAAQQPKKKPEKKKDDKGKVEVKVSVNGKDAKADKGKKK
jgi:hypothetical protein